MKPAARYLVSSILGVIIVAAAATAGVLWQARQAAHRQVLEQLKSAPHVAEALQASRIRELQLRAHALASDPAFVDYVAQSLTPNPALGGGIDSASINNLLDERRHGYDTAVVLDAQGKLITRSGMPLRSNSDFRHDSLVHRVLTTRKPASGLWSGQGHLAWVAVEPLLRGDQLEGVLVAASRVDAAFAKHVGDIVRTQVALVVPSESGATVPVSNRLDPSTLSAIDSGNVNVLAGADVPAHALRVPIHDGTAIAWVRPLAATDGTAALVVLDRDAGHAVTLVPVAVRPLLAGIAALALLALFRIVLGWRRMYRPMEEMHRILARAAAGETGITLRTGGNRAVRNLRDIINEVLARHLG